MTKIQETGDRVLANVERVIVGKHHEVRLALVALLCRGHLLIEDVPGTGKTVLAKAIARSLGCSFRRIQFTPDLLPSDVSGLSIYNQKTQEFEFRPGPDLQPGGPRRRDQPRDAQDPVRAARMHGGAPGHDRRHDLPDARPVPRHRHPEPDRVRGHVRAARGAARPVHAPPPARLPAADRGDRHPRRAEADASARRARGGADRRGPARDAGGDPRDLRRLDRLGLHRPAGQRHADPRRRLPRRVAARLDRAVSRGPGAGRPARSRLRHPRRRQGPRRARPGPPPDHQDELVDPRRAGRRRSCASCSRRRAIDGIRPTGGGGPTRAARPGRGQRVRRRQPAASRPDRATRRRDTAGDPQARTAHRRRRPRRRRVLDRGCRSCSTCSTWPSSSSAARTSSSGSG